MDFCEAKIILYFSGPGGEEFAPSGKAMHGSLLESVWLNGCQTFWGHLLNMVSLTNQ